MEYQAEFLERIERTPAAVSYRFKRAADLQFIAGQYMLVDLGDELIHPLSLSDCPEETGFIEFTKRMTGSPYCQRLEALNQGDTVMVKGPAGKFYFEPPDNNSLVLIAGGIGITPIRSILKSLAKTKQPLCRIILLYGNLNRDDIAFRTELENLTLPDYRLVHVLADISGMAHAYQGLIDADIIAREVPASSNACYMISGPPAMVEALKKALATINVAADRIRIDVFSGYA